MTTSTHRPMNTAQAKPHAMALLIDLGEAIGDKDGIQAALNRAMDEHPHDWPLVVASALAWTFAEHARTDPDWTPPRGATP